MNPFLTLGYSPCPNDTFLFYALAHGRVPLAGLRRPPLLTDVETLNKRVLQGRLAISKISCPTLAHVGGKYALLRSGAALGRGYGPLVVARKEYSRRCFINARIAIPGPRTSAHLLLRLWQPDCRNLVELPFADILPALRRGEVDAGVIIHEGRFTYAASGLLPIIDLGAWWKQLTGLPLPLGVVVARRNLGRQRIARIEAAVAASAAYARSHPQQPLAYVRAHAREAEEPASLRHIDLYVTDDTLDLGDEGRAAIAELLGRGAAGGLIPAFRVALDK